MSGERVDKEKEEVKKTSQIDNLAYGQTGTVRSTNNNTQTRQKRTASQGKNLVWVYSQVIARRMGYVEFIR